MISETTELLISDALRSPYRSMDELDALIALMPPDPDDEPRKTVCDCGHPIEKPARGYLPEMCKTCREVADLAYFREYNRTRTGACRAQKLVCQCGNEIARPKRGYAPKLCKSCRVKVRQAYQREYRGSARDQSMRGEM